jgi:hypothetical protein
MESKTKKFLVTLAACAFISLLLQTSNQYSFAQEQMPMPDALTAQALAMLSTTNSPITLDYPAPPVEQRALLDTATSQSTNLINLADFRNDNRFAGIDGSGVAVVILDTGIDLDHSFFGPDNNNDGQADRIAYHWDFADNDPDATDRNGHGSNVSSIIGSSDETYTGMAPGVDIIHLKVFSDSGSGNFGNVEAALSWVVANATTYNIVSVNMSLGDSGNHTIEQARYGIGDEMAALSTLGVTVVSSSGNSFYSYSSQQGVGYPSADPNSLSIGAVYDTDSYGWSYSSGAQAYRSSADAITPFSQRHETMSTIFAPGAPIVGAGPTGGLTIMHGTSQSAPHIAGIIALMQQLAFREMGRYLTVAEVETLLVSTATNITDGDDENDNVTNTGLIFPRVNVLALGEALLGEDTSPPQVSQIASNINTSDGIGDNKSVNANISKLVVTFNESVQNPVGNDAPNDVTNTTNYLLVADGDDAEFETAVCGSTQGDDNAVVINSVTYNNDTKTATVAINDGDYLPEDDYRFFVCKENLQDLAGNYLNGGENDYSLTFSVKTPEMVFLPMITN